MGLAQMVLDIASKFVIESGARFGDMFCPWLVYEEKKKIYDDLEGIYRLYKYMTTKILNAVKSGA